jgi:hypothetical protein
MENKIYSLTGTESYHSSDRCTINPVLFHHLENAKKSAISRFITWLRDMEIIYAVDGTEYLFLDELEPEGTFDDLTVADMGKDEHNRVPVETLDKFLNGMEFCSLYAGGTHSCEDYIEIQINEAEFED